MRKVLKVLVAGAGIAAIGVGVSKIVEKVSHTKFKKFCRNKDLNCRSNTMLERTGFFDEYDNLVAYYVWGRKSNNSDAEYYINPKLYELSQEQKQRIKNEYTQVREPALIATLDDVKSMKIK